MADDVILYPIRKQLRKFFGGHDKLYPFMELNTMDMVVLQDDFIEKLDVTYKWGSKASGGVQTGTVANTVNGICRLSTGAVTDQYVYLFPNTDGGMEGGVILGTLSPVMWVRLKVNTLTTVKIECGFTDSDADAGAVTTLATPDCLADDCALWCFDTDDASGGTYWQGVTNIGGTEGTKYEPAVATVTPVIATYEWLGVAIQENDSTNSKAAVKFMHMNQYGVPDKESAWLTSRITSTDPLIPWVGVHARANSDRLLDIDYIKVWQRRTTRDD